MSLLLSNYPPLRLGCDTFSSVFTNLLKTSEQVDIAIGYISEKSLDHLAGSIHSRGKPYCNLIIGMHYFEKFTYSQYASAKEIEKFLVDNKLGSVRLVNSFPYHGKLYSFRDKNNKLTSIIGSSNLNNILEHKVLRQYELDMLIDDRNTNLKLKKFIDKLINISPELSSETLIIDSFKEVNNLMEGITGVEKIELENLNNFKNSIIPAQKIKLPITTYEQAPKSNINAYFGKGRENTRTKIIRRRPWYEVELIIPKLITNLPWYPRAGYPEKENIITVFTDDHYKFECKISGTNSKNFRSVGDLKILGKWLKGRLENSGCLNMDEPVTDAVLTKYGRNNIEFIPSTTPNTWYLDFSKN